MPQLVTQSANRRAGREIYVYGWQIKQGINLIGKTIEKFVKKNIYKFDTQAHGNMCIKYKRV